MSKPLTSVGGLLMTTLLVTTIAAECDATTTTNPDRHPGTPYTASDAAARPAGLTDPLHARSAPGAELSVGLARVAAVDGAVPAEPATADARPATTEARPAPAGGRTAVSAAKATGTAKMFSHGTRSTTALKTGPTFNWPVGKKSSQQAIVTKVDKLISGASKGSVIYVGMYHFSVQDMAKRLVAAKKRKVQVRVVLDYESTQYKAYTTLRKGLGTSTKKSSWVMHCGKGHGCIGPSFNHNKFFLFSTTLHQKRVVVQTSANSTYNASDLQWNDALTLKNSGLYAAYRHYFYDLAAQHRTGDYHRVVRTGKYQVDFFPWASGDPISQALDEVSCVGGTRVRLMLGHFTWSPVAKRLWNLDDAGCQVQVLFSHVGQTVSKDLTKSGGLNGGPEIRYIPENGHPYEHSKYLLIDGGYQDKRQKVVFVGSANYTDIAFHGHDEAMINVADPTLEGQYLTNFNAVFKRGGAVHSTAFGPALPRTVIEPDWADDTTNGTDN